MKKSLLLFAAVAMVVAACSQKDVEGEIEIILPESENGTNEIVAAIKNIEVINLQVDSNYMYNEDAQLRVSDNYYYFVTRGLIDRTRIQLMCYEKATGKLLCSRNIKGRAQSECTEYCNSFVKDDKIVINDYGTLKEYDHTGKFCGMKGETRSNNLLPLGDGYVNFIADGYGNEGKSIMLLDSKFNELESYFDVPEEYITGTFVRHSTSPNQYVFNDTLRFTYQYTFRLHYFPGGKTYHFVSAHPIPQSLLANPNGEFKSITFDCLNNEYAHSLDGLAENQNYIAFKYLIGNCPNFVLFSKRDNKVFNVGDESAEIDENNFTQILWINLLIGADNIYSDGKFFYARLNISGYKFWEKHKDAFDARQKVLFDAMTAQLAAYGGDDFQCFYLKFEF